MVSSCALYLDDIDLTGQKASVPDFLSAMFQESDRTEGRDSDDSASVKYQASRASVLLRLSLMGCTEALTRRSFDEWKRQALREADDEEMEEEAAEDEAAEDEAAEDEAAEDETEEEIDEESAALRALTWEEWQRRVPEVLRTYYNDEYKDVIDRRMKDSDPSYSWLWFDGWDSLISIRAILEACADVATVVLDVGPLIHGGWIDASHQVCGDRVRVVSQRGQASGPAIVLAEGRSDIALLKAATQHFYPDASDFLTFLDHTEFRVDGGASYVVKFLKAFAAARVPANIVAVFDNDTAGRAAYREARVLKLPSNMVCVHLPDTELARHYPTIGPQGFHHTNVNGTAAGIELYLGEKALSVDGQFRPVRWTGYDQNAGAYQGEIEGKSEVQKAFLQALSGESNLNAYPELRSVLQTIFDAAARAAETSQVRARIPTKW